MTNTIAFKCNYYDFQEIATYITKNEQWDQCNTFLKLYERYTYLYLMMKLKNIDRFSFINSHLVL